MKKQIILILLCSLLFVGCKSDVESASKVDDTLMNHFTKSEQALIKEINPDVVTMQYLVDHSEDYAVSLDSDRNDFFVIVRGTVTKLENVTYDDEILNKMDPDIASLLRDKTSVDFYLDDCPISMSDTDSNFGLELDNEYYFYTHVTEGATGYRYTPFKCFKFN